MKITKRTKRVLSILLSLALILGQMPGISVSTMASTENVTVVWSSANGGSFDQSIVRLENSDLGYNWGDNEWQLAYWNGSGTFTVSDGVFTRIEINGGYILGFSGTGWSGGRTWTGSASAVPFSGCLTDSYGGSPFTITFTLLLHTHDFTYEANGATITATCSDEQCILDDGQGNHTATVTIDAPPAGNPAAGAQITDELNLHGDAAVIYYNADASGNKTGDALEGIPTEVGKYWAELTVGDATAHIVYDVESVASIEDKGYAALTAAIADVTDGQTIKLTADVAGCYTFDKSGVSATLDLNGHTIDGNQKGSVITIQNGTLILDDSSTGKTGAITGGKTTGNGGGVLINSGSFIMKDGSIEGNIASNGAVSVSGSAVFEMQGGKIQYNEGAGNTGGVLVMNNNFTMSGGTIQYNVGKNFGGIGIAGAQPSFSGTAVVKDNVIASNTTGMITKTENGYTLAEGGTPCDVKHASGNGLNITIVGELKDGAKIGIFNNNQTNAFSTGYNTHNSSDAAGKFFFSDDENYGVHKNDDGELILGEPVHEAATVTNNGTTTSYGTLADALDAWTDGTTLTLMADAELAERIRIIGSKTIDLNGYGLKSITEGQQVFIIEDENANLTINDGASNRTDTGNNRPEGIVGGYLTGGKNDNYGWGGGIYLGNGDTLTLNGGTIVGNSAHQGGGVVINGATFNMNGGAITGNNANYGGGVAVSYGGTFNMTGGTISGNTAQVQGGGVFDDANINISGGSIIGNSAANKGGGIIVYDGKSITLTGGNIENNTANGEGGGMEIGIGVNFKMSGDPVVQNNTSGSKTENIYLEHNTFFDITDALDSNASIGVTMQFASVFTNSSNTDCNVASCFTSDSTNHTIVKNADGQLMLDGPVYIFDATSASDELYRRQINIPALYGINKTSKIEALIDMESVADDGWAQLQVGHRNSDPKSETISDTPGIQKYTLEYSDTMDDVSFGILQLIGKAKLLAMTVTNYDGTTTTYGRWDADVTYKVEGGTWSDDSTADITENVQRGSKPAGVPTNMKASDGYKGGSWDTDPTDAIIADNTTFTYTFEMDPGAAAVAELFDALPSADDITTEIKGAIEVAREAYDALTDDQKALISDDTLKKLTDAEDALAVLETGDSINALPAAGDVTKDNADAIKAAREAYDALTDAQKALISDDTLKKLTDAEDALAALEEANNHSAVKANVVNGNGIMFTAGIDTLKYKEVGFIFEANGKEVRRGTNTVYSSIDGSEYGVSDFDNANYIYSFTIEDIANAGTEIKVTPYSIDLKGKETKGETQTYSITQLNAGGGALHMLVYSNDDIVSGGAIAFYGADVNTDEENAPVKAEETADEPDKEEANVTEIKLVEVEEVLE